MSPSFDGEIRLGPEANAKDDNGEECGHIARKFPIFPFSRLPWWCWSPVEQVAIRPILMTGTRPATWTRFAAASRAKAGEKAVSEGARGRGEGLS